MVAGEDLLHLFRGERMPLDVEDVFIVPLESGNDHAISYQVVYTMRYAVKRFTRSAEADDARLALRFLADHAKDFGLRSGGAHIIRDSDQQRLRPAALFDDDGAALVLNTAQNVA